MDHAEAEQSQAVERYLLGELTGPEREAFEEHYFACPKCAQEVLAGETLGANVRAVLAGRATADLRIPRPGRLAWLGTPPPKVAWAAAALFAVVAGYQGLVVTPRMETQLSELASPQPVARHVLRPLTRAGEMIRIAAQPRGFVTLALPLDVLPDFERLAVEVRDRGGATVARIETAVPRRPGEPLEVLMPARRLPPGAYTVVVYGWRGGERTEVGTYPFTVEP